MTTQKGYIVSRKILSSIESNLETIFDGTFTESNIKMLLVDVREVAKMYRSENKEKILSGSQKSIYDSIVLIHDLADFILHSERDRGKLKSIIQKAVKSFAGNPSNESENKSGDKYIFNISLALGGLFEIICRLLDRGGSKIKPKDLSKIWFEKIDEIELCIFSLLQDRIIWENDNEYMILYIGSLDNYYTLMCNIVSGSMVNFFSIHKSKKTDDFNLDYSKNPIFPRIFETYRDLEKLLRFREIPRGHNSDFFFKRFNGSILKNYQKIINGTFLEGDIKELFIDLREYISKDYHSIKEPTGTVIKDLFDICTSIVHHNNFDKNSILSKRINFYISSVGIFGDLDIKTASINGDSISEKFLHFAEKYLEIYGINIGEQTKQATRNKVSEIGLCIISNLQGHSIKFREDASEGVFFIDLSEKCLCLHVQTLLTIKDKPKKYLKTIQIHTSYKKIDSFDDKIEIFKKIEPHHPCIETFRDNEGNLRIRLL